MKKVIDGKVYNTDTAEEVGSWDNGGFPGDFNRCEEALYKTPKGAYFLYGSGGARSRWGRSVEAGNAMTSGEDIVALSETEAQTWCEEHGIDADVIAAHFRVEEA